MTDLLLLAAFVVIPITGFDLLLRFIARKKPHWLQTTPPETEHNMTTPIERAAKALYNSPQPPSHDTEAHIVFASIDVLDLVDVIEGAHTDHPSCALEPVGIANAIIAYLTGDTR